MQYNFSAFVKSTVLAAVVMTFASIGTLYSLSITKEVTYGESDEDYGINAARTADGGVVQIGYSGSGTDDMLYVVRSDDEANRVWEKKYEITYIENKGAILEAANGDLVWTATVQKTPTSDADIMVCRTDANGVIQWMRLIGENNAADDYGTSLIEAANGDIVVCGWTTLLGQDKAVVVRLNSAGAYSWGFFYGSSSTLHRDQAYDLVELSGGDLALCGATFGAGLSANGWIFSIGGGSGLVNWSNTYGSDDALQEFYSIITNSNGDLYACGSWFNRFNDSRIFAAFVDPASGTANALRTFGYMDNHRITALSINRSATPDELVLTGSIEDAGGSASRPAFFLEVDAGLGLIRFKVYGVDGISVGNAIEHSPASANTDAGYWICGHSTAFSGSYDFYQIRSNLTGYTECARDESVNEKDEGVEEDFPLIRDAYGSTTVINPPDEEPVTHEEVCPEKWVDPWFGKRSFVPNSPLSGGESILITDLRLAPNPAVVGNEFRLEVNAIQNVEVTLTLRDVHGRAVIRKQHTLTSGRNAFRLDTEGLSAGVYYLHVGASEFSRALQLTLLR